MLTCIQINAAKPRAKAWNLSDSRNLYLVIQPHGSKLWRFNYRFLDKQKKPHLGGWPIISLAEARARRDEAKKKIANGIDPALEKKRARIAAKYGVATVRCDRDVAADLRGAIAVPKVEHFAAITRRSEVGALLRAIDGYSGYKVTVMAMRLSPHVLLRLGELRQAEWTDIDFEEAIWFIPAERMKMRRPHRVPLSRQVIAMLKELPTR